MFEGIVFKKNSHGISEPNKIFFSPGSIISNDGLISLELDNYFHLYESKGKSLIFDINSKKRIFYGDLKLDNSVDFALDYSHYTLDSLISRGILEKVSLFESFRKLNILDSFVNSINYLTHDDLKKHSGLNILEFLKVSGLNVPLKYEFSKVLSGDYYVLTEYGSKHLYLTVNNYNVFGLRTLHKLSVI